MAPASPSPVFTDVTLAMISWKAPQTVAHTLESYHRAGILDVFAARRLHFNEITDADRDIAARYGFTSSGTVANVGIFGGVDALAAATTTDYFLLVENDCPVLTGRDGFVAMLASVIADMRTLDVPVFLMRSRAEPGEPFWRRSRYEQRFRPVWPLGAPPHERRPLPPLPIRLYEDVRRASLRGSAIYAEQDPTVRHPGVISRTANGNWVTRSNTLQWSNCCVMVSTPFLRSVVLDRVRRYPAKTTLNGHQDIEAALKRANWWRRQNFKIGQCEPGPFTHQRLDR